MKKWDIEGLISYGFVILGIIALCVMVGSQIGILLACWIGGQ